MNKEFDVLIKKIGVVEKILAQCKEEKYSEPIDMNLDNWLEIAKQRNIDFYEENREILESMSKMLIESFPDYYTFQRREILTTLRASKILRTNLSTNLYEENSEDWFKEKVLFFILNDLGNDTRDGLLEINALNDRSKEKNVDLKEIIKSNIELANDENWHGMGSTKSLLQNVISE